MKKKDSPWSDPATRLRDDGEEFPTITSWSCGDGFGMPDTYGLSDGRRVCAPAALDAMREEVQAVQRANSKLRRRLVETPALQWARTVMDLLRAIEGRWAYLRVGIAAMNAGVGVYLCVVGPWTVLEPGWALGVCAIGAVWAIVVAVAALVFGSWR